MRRQGGAADSAAFAPSPEPSSVRLLVNEAPQQPDEKGLRKATRVTSHLVVPELSTLGDGDYFLKLRPTQIFKTMRFGFYLIIKGVKSKK